MVCVLPISSRLLLLVGNIRNGPKSKPVIDYFGHMGKPFYELCAAPAPGPTRAEGGGCAFRTDPVEVVVVVVKDRYYSISNSTSKIEYRWISLNAFKMSNALTIQSGFASERSVTAMISCDPPQFVLNAN